MVYGMNNRNGKGVLFVLLARVQFPLHQRLLCLHLPHTDRSLSLQFSVLPYASFNNSTHYTQFKIKKLSAGKQILKNCLPAEDARILQKGLVLGYFYIDLRPIRYNPALGLLKRYFTITDCRMQIPFHGIFLPGSHGKIIWFRP